MIYKSPSNLALIKYIGKKSVQKNIPINPSLSYTLEHLVSGVRISKSKKDEWKPLQGEEWLDISLTSIEKKRFLDFFKKLKHLFGLEKFYLVESANNFPKNSGIASSASSFSALTTAAYNTALKDSAKKEVIGSLTSKELSQISQKGSGSSCRSFFKPWCLWEEDNIQSLSFPFDKLWHDLICFDQNEKQVSSSKAHQQIQTSPYFIGRPMRAKSRLKKLIDFMKKQSWMDIYQVVKDEFEDMHLLFETSSPAFSYRNTRTRQALKVLEKFWKDHQDGPLITMDAGSYIHLLYRLDQVGIRKKINETLNSLK